MSDTFAQTPHPAHELVLIDSPAETSRYLQQPTQSTSNWPGDYDTINGGDLMIRSDCVERFRLAGWLTVNDLMHADNIVQQRDLGHRSNGTALLASPNAQGDDTLLVYIKRHPKQQLEPNPFETSPIADQRVGAGIAEANASAFCKTLGIGTASVVAAGQSACPKTDIEEQLYHSVFISEGLTQHQQADTFWEQHFGDSNSTSTNENQRRRRNLLKAIAVNARKLHDASVYHRDLYWCHFMVHEIETAQFDVRLIDLQRLWKPIAIWRPYVRLKDLAQFWLSKPKGLSAPTEDERRYWFACYQHADEVVNKQETTNDAAPRLNLFDRIYYHLIRLRAAMYRVKGVRG